MLWRWASLARARRYGADGQGSVAGSAELWALLFDGLRLPWGLLLSLWGTCSLAEISLVPGSVLLT